MVRFQCVKDDKNKLRIRIISPNYNPYANCSFPRNIRREGGIYEAPKSAVSFNRNNNIQFFYRVSKSAIQIIENPELEIPDDMQIFEIPECVICLSEPSNIIFLKCGHYCVCVDCNKQLKKRCCPLCREKILDTITRDQL